VGRTCTVCGHDEAHAVNVALVAREPYRAISRRSGLSKDALKRHSQEHIPELLVKARHAVESADADDLLERVESLQERTLAILETAEDSGELRTALGAIREARSNLELLAKLLGELDERPQVNLYLSPEWLELRAVIVTALEPHPEARGAVLGALEGAGNGRA
jgi:hypothetical protein